MKHTFFRNWNTGFLMLLIGGLMLLPSGCASLDNSRVMVTGNGHHDAIVELFAHPDGKRLISVSRDRNVCVWDRQSGNLISTIYTNQGPTGESGDIYAAALTKNGQVLAVAGRGLGKGEGQVNFIRLLDVDSEKLIGVLKGKGPNRHFASIYNLAFSPRDDKLLSIDQKGKGLVWTAETSQPIEFGYLNPNVAEVKFKPRAMGSKLSGTNFGRIYYIRNVPEFSSAVIATDQGLVSYFWNTKSIQLLSPNKDDIPGFGVRSDSVIIYSKREGSLWAWKKTSYNLKEQKLAELPYPPHLISFSEKGDKYLISSGMRCDHLVVEALTGKVLCRLEPLFHQDLLTSCVFLDNDQVAIGDMAGRIGIWDANTGGLIQQLGGPTFPIRTVSWEQNSSIRFGACFGKENVNLCDTFPIKKAFPIHPTPYEFSLTNLSLRLVNGKPTRKGGSAKAAGFTLSKDEAGGFTLEVPFLTGQAIPIKNENLAFSIPMVGAKQEVFLPVPAGFSVIGKDRAAKKKGLSSFMNKSAAPGLESVTVYEGQYSQVHSIDESPAQTGLVTGGQDRILRIWDHKKLELIASIYFDQEANWICWTPDLYYCSGTLEGFNATPKDLRSKVTTVDHNDEESLPSMTNLAGLPDDRNNRAVILERLSQLK